MTLMVWLTGAPYLIMKELSIGSQSPTEVAKALSRPIQWVSKRTGRMQELGLLVKEDPDDHGVKVMTLTEKGRRVMGAIAAIRDNSLFVELRRALDLKGPGDDARVLAHSEAERVKEAMTSGTGKLDFERLFNAALDASSSKTEGWYASEDLTYLFSTLDAERWDEPSRLLLIRIIGRAIIDSRNDRDYVTTYNGLLDPLTRLAMKKDADRNVRAESIMAIGSLREHNGNVPNSPLMSIIQLQWDMLSPEQEGLELIEDAISHVLKSWASLLNEDQRELLLASVGQMHCDRMPFMGAPKKEGEEVGQRKVDEVALQRYRSLSAIVTGRIIDDSSNISPSDSPIKTR